MRRLSSVTLKLRASRPSIRIRPESCSYRRLTIFSRVVLPHPDGPSKTTRCPWGTSRVTSSTAARTLPGKRLVTCSNTMAGPGAGILLGQQAFVEQPQLRYVVGVFLVAGDVPVHRGNLLVGDQGRDFVEQIGHPGIGGEHIVAHHGGHVVGWAIVLGIVEQDEAEAGDLARRAVGLRG